MYFLYIIVLCLLAFSIALNNKLPFLYMHQMAIYFVQESSWTAWQAQLDRPNVIPLEFFQQINRGYHRFPCKFY